MALSFRVSDLSPTVSGMRGHSWYNVAKLSKTQTVNKVNKINKVNNVYKTNQNKITQNKVNKNKLINYTWNNKKQEVF